MGLTANVLVMHLESCGIRSAVGVRLASSAEGLKNLVSVAAQLLKWADSRFLNTARFADYRSNPFLSQEMGFP
jgi:hypothetical protein